MIGVPIDGSALMLVDNKSVVINTTIPSSALKKKHNAIAYHQVREAIAARLIASCACFHEHLAAKLLALGFNPSKADPDLWYRDKGDHYEYVATYIDDLLIASRNPESIVQAMEERYILKRVGVPSYYLGGDVIQGHTLDEWKPESIDWILASKTYDQKI